MLVVLLMVVHLVPIRPWLYGPALQTTSDCLWEIILLDQRETLSGQHQNEVSQT